MTIDKIKKFLKLNGWKEQLITDEFEEYFSFTHEYNYGIDLGIEDGEIVVLADEGDIFHIEMNRNSIYTLVGFLVRNPCDDICLKYKFPQKENNPK